MITKVPLWMPASDTRDLFGLESMFKRMAQVLASGHASARLPWTRLQDSSETLTVIIDDVCDFPFLHAEWQHQVPSFKYIFHVVEVHCILVANDVRELGLRDVMCEAPSIWWKLQYANDDADSAMWDYVSSSTSTGATFMRAAVGNARIASEVARLWHGRQPTPDVDFDQLVPQLLLAALTRYWQLSRLSEIDGVVELRRVRKAAWDIMLTDGDEGLRVPERTEEQNPIPVRHLIQRYGADTAT